MAIVKHPCGHSSKLDACWLSKDHYRCPTCRQEWIVEQDSPRVLKTGFIMPGDRRVKLLEAPLVYSAGNGQDEGSLAGGKP